jgi:hypothetical protein
MNVRLTFGRDLLRRDVWSGPDFDHGSRPASDVAQARRIGRRR